MIRRAKRSGRLGDEAGGAAVDFGLILPFLMAMLYGIIELGRLMWGVAVLHFAVEQGARYAVVDSGMTCPTDATPTQNYAAGFAGWAVGWGVQASDFSVSCSCPNGVVGTQVSVTAQFSTPILAGLFSMLRTSGKTGISVGAQSCYPT